MTIIYFCGLVVSTRPACSGLGNRFRLRSNNYLMFKIVWLDSRIFIPNFILFVRQVIVVALLNQYHF